jgi:GNAT superfamily N-acetyltransferase
MVQTEIREMVAGDVQPLSDAFLAIGWQRPPSWFQRFIDEGARGERWAWVALVDGAYAGYVTLLPRSAYAPLAGTDTPEISDLNTLPQFRRRGIANALLDQAEAKARELSNTIAIAVGLHAGYNTAQRLYVKRGYIPDGRGITYHGRYVGEYEDVTMDDDLLLHLTKDL